MSDASARTRDVMKSLLAPLPVVCLILLVPACAEGSKTADVVQAASRDLAEAGQKLAARAAELAEVAPEEARAQVQGLLDTAARELREVRDSETARRVVTEVQRAVEALAELARQLGEALDLEGLMRSVDEQITRFRDDPRVEQALEGLKERLRALGGSEE